MSNRSRPALTLCDAMFTATLAGLFLPFVLLPPALALFKTLTLGHPLALSFIKFAVLATLGELLGLRIRTGRYRRAGFGILPRAVVWGVLGIGIYVAFVTFAAGAPAALRAMGVPITVEVMLGPLSWLKVLGAFWISLTMNLCFAPVMMTLHKVTDEHIRRQGGRLRGLLRTIPFGDILAGMDWSVMWGFVFKLTIPLFWVPAHTVTFLLPPEYRILFAAVLGITLGALLATASLRSHTGH